MSLSPSKTPRAGLPPVFRYSQARAAGISTDRLHSLRARGLVEQISRGLYRWADAPAADTDLLEIAARAPLGTLCLLSALAQHGLTDASSPSPSRLAAASTSMHSPARTINPMTSSSAPPTAPASEPLRFTDAARLHARRFNKHPLASALRLLNADQRITHPDGGIALLTEAGHVARSTLAFVATFVPAFAVMLVCIANGKVAIALAATAVSAASALVLAPRCERQIRARRTYVPSTRTWVLSDVATEPHRGIGDALMREVERCADQASATVVLEVADVNEVAKRLYLKHGFRIFCQRADRLLMRRAVDPT